MKILITGAAGFIGSHLAEAWLAEDHEVWGVDNMSGVYPAAVYALIAKTLKNYSNFTSIESNINSDQSNGIAQLPTDFDVIFHVAALTGVRDSAQKAVAYIENNVLGTQRLLEHFKHSSARLIIFSSSSVYGSQDSTPFTEDMLPRPRSMYAISKYTTELLAEYYARQHRTAITIVRPFSVYGPRGRLNMLPALLIKALLNNKPFEQYGNNESNKRDWTYIDDFVRAVKKIATIPFQRFDVVNIGSGSPVGIADYLNLVNNYVQKYFEKKAMIMIVDKPDVEMDITHAATTKLNSLMDELRPTSLEQGLDITVRYLADHRTFYFSEISE